MVKFTAFIELPKAKSVSASGGVLLTPWQWSLPLDPPGSSVSRPPL